MADPVVSSPAPASPTQGQTSNQGQLPGWLSSLVSYFSGSAGQQSAPVQQPAGPQVLSPGQYLASGQPAQVRPTLAGDWSFNKYYQAPKMSSDGQALLTQAKASPLPTTSGFSYLTDLQSGYDRKANMTASAKAAAEAKALADQAKQALADAQARKNALAKASAPYSYYKYTGNRKPNR